MGVDIRVHHKVSPDTAQAMLSLGYTTLCRCWLTPSCTELHCAPARWPEIQRREFCLALHQFTYLSRIWCLEHAVNIKVTLANGWPGRKKLAVACSSRQSRLVATARCGCSKASVRSKCYNLCQRTVYG